LQKSAILSPSHWGLSPYSDPALQIPTSGEFLPVSPVLPKTLPFSDRQYTIPFQQIGFDHKADQPLQYNNSAFDDWRQWGNSTGNILSYTDQSDDVNFKLAPISPVIEALELSGEVGIAQIPAAIYGGLDNGSVVFQDSIIDRPLFPAPQEILSQQNSAFYTNQLSQSQPQPLPLPDDQAHQPRNRYLQLSTEQASNPIRITVLQSATAKSSESPQQPRSQRKRKTTTSSVSSSSNLSPSHLLARRYSAPKKIVHNIVEKQYRTNLNNKIAALRDSVPSLRITKKSSNSDASIGENLQGLEAVYKLNKV
jgi:hypothetical protein